MALTSEKKGGILAQFRMEVGHSIAPKWFLSQRQSGQSFGFRVLAFRLVSTCRPWFIAISKPRSMGRARRQGRRGQVDPRRGYQVGGQSPAARPF